MIAGDDILNPDELTEIKTGSTFTVTGTISNPNADLTVTFNDKIYSGSQVTINTDGIWSIQVPVEDIKSQNTVTAHATAITEDGSQAESGVVTREPITAGSITVDVNIHGQITGVTTEVSAGQVVELVLIGHDKNGVQIETKTTATVNVDGTYQALVPPEFMDGDIQVFASTTDANDHPLSSIDNESQLNRSEGGITVNVTPDGQITGTTADVPPNSIVELVITGQDPNGEPIQEIIKVTTDDNGHFSSTVPPSFADGDIEVTGTTTDRNGKPIADTDHEPQLDRSEGNIIVDVTLDGQITGTTADVPPNSTVELVITGQDKDGKPVQVEVKVPVAADGKYSYQITGKEVDSNGNSLFMNGSSIEVVATTTDRNGKVIDDQDAEVVDIISPTAPNVVINDGNDGFINPSDIVNGKVTATVWPNEPVQVDDTITITLPDGSTEVVKVTSTNVSAINTNGYTVEFVKPDEGTTFTVSATVTDSFGNESKPSNDNSTVDTQLPTIQIDSYISTDNKVSSEESNEPLTIFGTTDAEDEQVVTVKINNQEYTAIVTDGKWTVDLSKEDVALLPKGQVPITAQVKDKAGNVAQDDHEISVDFDAPQITPISVQGSEDSAVELTWANFGITDANTPEDDLRISISKLPIGGVLYLDGQAVTDVSALKNLSKADIDDGKLSFKPEENQASEKAGAAYTQLEFTVTDQVNTSSGTMSVIIDAVADEPKLKINTSEILKPEVGNLSTSIYYGEFTNFGTSGQGITYNTFKAGFDSQKVALYQGSYKTGSINSSNDENRHQILEQYKTTIERDAEIKSYLDQGYKIGTVTRVNDTKNMDLAGEGTSFNVELTKEGQVPKTVKVEFSDYTTVAETKGIIYLKAGETYEFSGTFDDSAGIFIGAGANVEDTTSGAIVTSPYDGAWFKGYGTTSTFKITVPEDGYYDFRFVTHNQSGEGRYVLTLNGKELNSEYFTLFPTDEALREAAAGSEDSDKIRIEYYKNKTTGSGYYKLYNANDGVVGKDVPLSTIDAKLIDSDGSEQLTVTLSDIPQGVILTDGNNTYTSTSKDKSIDVTKWDLANLKVQSATEQDFTIKVEVTSTEQSNSDAASTSAEIKVSIKDDGVQGEVIYPVSTISSVSNAITAAEDTDIASSATLLFNSESKDMIFDLLSDDNLGGNDVTTVSDFTADDHIDISKLLDSNASRENIHEYLTVNYDAEHGQIVIALDRDGQAARYQSTELLVLNNQTTDLTLEELLQNQQIII